MAPKTKKTKEEKAAEKAKLEEEARLAEEGKPSVVLQLMIQPPHGSC